MVLRISNQVFDTLDEIFDHLCGVEYQCRISHKISSIYFLYSMRYRVSIILIPQRADFIRYNCGLIQLSPCGLILDTSITTTAHDIFLILNQKHIHVRSSVLTMFCLCAYRIFWTRQSCQKKYMVQSKARVFSPNQIPFGLTGLSITLSLLKQLHATLEDITAG